MAEANIWIGTSGWVYKEWAGHFYPKGWRKKDEFDYYVRHFPTVEINATFYRLPTLQMVRGWHDRAPKGFVFAVKGSRFLTHIKRLRDTSRGLQKYIRRLRPLGDRTGPILWQLPPNFVKNEASFKRLERFLQKVPKAYRHAVEFRHPSWMDEQTFALLRQHRACCVWLSSLKMPADYTLTSDFVYLRFHGLQGGAYHDYTESELAPWAKELVKAARRGLPAYVYFNNDLNTRAPLNAAALMKLVGRHVVGPQAATSEPWPEIAPPLRGPESWPSWNRRSGRKRGAQKARRPSPGHWSGMPIYAASSALSPTATRSRARRPTAATVPAGPPTPAARRRR